MVSKKTVRKTSKKKRVLSDEEKEQARQKRIQNGADKFNEMLAVTRPGIQRTAITEPVTFQKIEQTGLEISDVFYVQPGKLQPNPLNDYTPLEAAEMAELMADITDKGIIVPLLARQDDVLICGHNRLAAAISLNLDRVPLQRVLGKLTPELEKDIMKSENDRRRGGNWSKEKKIEFIQEQFSEEIQQDNRGGDFGNQYTGGKSSMNFGQKNISKQIEKKSRGKITEGTAKRIVSEIRKKQAKKAVKPVQKEQAPVILKAIRFRSAVNRELQQVRPVVAKELLKHLDDLRKEVRKVANE